MKTMHTISYYSESGPAFENQAAHILCADKVEQDRVVAMFKRFYPKLQIFVREINAETAREEIPFLYHPDNAHCAQYDHFFRVDKFIHAFHEEAIFAPLTREEFFGALGAVR